MHAALWRLAIAVMAGVAVFVAAHLAIWRATPSSHPRIRLLGWLAAIGTSVSLITCWLMVGFKLTELCAVVWVDTFVIVFYLFVYAGVARSVSLTLLAQLSASTGSVNMDRLVADYLASSRLRDRIELMRASGLVRVTGDVVALTRRGARVAQGASLLSRLTCGDLRG